MLTNQEVDASTHHINKVESLAEKDIVRYGLRGALVGLVLALIVLLVALLIGLMTTIWIVPILFLAVIILGFCTWEGGLIGAHLPNRDVRKFREVLIQGQHVLFVDIEEHETIFVNQAVGTRPQVKSAGTGKPQPSTTWHLRQWVRDLIHKLP